MSITVRQLPRDAPSHEVEAAIQACTDAFKDNHLIHCSIGGHKSLLYSFNRAIIGAGIVGGKVYVAELPVEDEGKKIVGATAWFGPGEALLASEGQAEAGFNDFMVELGKKDPDVPKWWGTFLPEYEAFCNSALGSDTYKRTGWHLQWIGVHSNYQRRGAGTALIEHVKAIVRASPNPEERHMCLETDSEGGRKFYKTVGFVEKGTQTFRAEAKLNTDLQMWSLAQDL